MNPAVRIQLENFSQDAEIEVLQASSRRMGGIATFIGCARDFSERRSVSQISFDTYGSMALADTPPERDPAQLAQRFMNDADLVLAEGFSYSSGVKIEVLRRECGKPPRCSLAQNLIAMVTDEADVYPELPHFGLDDVAEIVDFMLGHSA